MEVVLTVPNWVRTILVTTALPLSLVRVKAPPWSLVVTGVVVVAS